MMFRPWVIVLRRRVTAYPTAIARRRALVGDSWSAGGHHRRMGERKRPRPNIIGTLANLQTQLVTRAEALRTAGVKGKIPSSDQTPLGAAHTFLVAHDAGGTFKVYKQPGQEVKIEVTPFRPDRMRPTLTLAYALLELATYEKGKKSRRAWTRALSLTDQLRTALIEALQDDDEIGSPDLVYRTHLIDRPLSDDAVPCIVAGSALKRRLEEFFDLDEPPLSELDEDVAAIARARRLLMCVFEPRDIASWVDDGQGGDLRQRAARVHKQRETAKKAVHQGKRSFPRVGVPTMVVSSEK
jgi:hypothetical protein